MTNSTLQQFLIEHREEIVEFVATIRPLQQRWASVAQAAAYSGLSIKSIRRLLSSGKLQAYRPIPGRVVIDIHEIDSLIASSTATPRRRRGVRR